MSIQPSPQKSILEGLQSASNPIGDCRHQNEAHRQGDYYARADQQADEHGGL